MATKAAINSSTLSSSQPPQVHNIKVGVGGFQFDPAELEDVKVGDTVTFEFYPPDHSVARAEFGSPCIPYEYTGREKQGFWSGTQWVKDVDHLSYFNITINSTEPIFYYCAAPEACTSQQMIGVINSNSTQTFSRQLRVAQEAILQLRPGDPIPAEATDSRYFTGFSPTERPYTSQDTSPTASPTGLSPASPDAERTLKRLEIYLPIGIVCLVAIFLLAGYTIWRYKRKNKVKNEVVSRDEDPWQKAEMDGVQTRHEAEDQRGGFEVNAGLRAELHGCEMVPQLLESSGAPLEIDSGVALHELSVATAELPIDNPTTMPLNGRYETGISILDERESFQSFHSNIKI